MCSINMSSLVFPARVDLAAQIWNGADVEPYRGGPLAFGIVTFARAKNDYYLGPLFTDESGVLSVTNHQLELCARAELSSGLMDYTSIHDAYALVELVHWSADEVARAVKSRTTAWNTLFDGEAELYGSVDSLVARLRQCGNRHFAPPTQHYGRTRDEWTDASRTVRYTHTITRA